MEISSATPHVTFLLIIALPTGTKKKRETERVYPQVTTGDGVECYENVYVLCHSSGKDLHNSLMSLSLMSKALIPNAWP